MAVHRQNAPPNADRTLSRCTRLGRCVLRFHPNRIGCPPFTQSFFEKPWPDDLCGADREGPPRRLDELRQSRKVHRRGERSRPNGSSVLFATDSDAAPVGQRWFPSSGDKRSVNAPRLARATASRYRAGGFRADPRRRRKRDQSRSRVEQRVATSSVGGGTW